MIVLFKIVLITFIWVIGVKISTSEGMVFEKLGKYANKKVDEGHKIWEALVVCEWCLPSVHSIFGHLFAFGLGVLPFEFNWQLLIRWPLVVMGTSIVSGLVWTVYLTLNEIKEKNKKQSEYFKYLKFTENEKE